MSRQHRWWLNKKCKDCKFFSEVGVNAFNNTIFYCIEPETLDNIGYIHRSDIVACPRFDNLNHSRKLKLEKIEGRG